MNTILNFAELVGFFIIAYIVYRNIKNRTMTTFTINSHQDTDNIYRGGKIFKERTIKPSWNKFTLVFFIIYTIVILYDKSPATVAFFEDIFSPYLIIYLIVKLVKWYKGINPNSNYVKRMKAANRGYISNIGANDVPGVYMGGTFPLFDDNDDD